MPLALLVLLNCTTGRWLQVELGVDGEAHIQRVEGCDTEWPWFLDAGRPGVNREGANQNGGMGMVINIVDQLRKEATRADVTDGAECCYAPKWTCCDRKLLESAATEITRLHAALEVIEQIERETVCGLSRTLAKTFLKKEEVSR